MVIRRNLHEIVGELSCITHPWFLFSVLAYTWKSGLLYPFFSVTLSSFLFTLIASIYLLITYCKIFSVHQHLSSIELGHPFIILGFLQSVFMLCGIFAMKIKTFTLIRYMVMSVPLDILFSAIFSTLIMKRTTSTLHWLGFLLGISGYIYFDYDQLVNDDFGSADIYGAIICTFLSRLALSLRGTLHRYYMLRTAHVRKRLRVKWKEKRQTLVEINPRYMDELKFLKTRRIHRDSALYRRFIYLNFMSELNPFTHDKDNLDETVNDDYFKYLHQLEKKVQRRKEMEISGLLEKKIHYSFDRLYDYRFFQWGKKRKAPKSSLWEEHHLVLKQLLGDEFLPEDVTYIADAEMKETNHMEKLAKAQLMALDRKKNKLTRDKDNIKGKNTGEKATENGKEEGKDIESGDKGKKEAKSQDKTPKTQEKTPKTQGKSAKTQDKASKSPETTETPETPEEENVMEAEDENSHAINRELVYIEALKAKLLANKRRYISEEDLPTIRMREPRSMSYIFPMSHTLLSHYEKLKEKNEVLLRGRILTKQEASELQNELKRQKAIRLGRQVKDMGVSNELEEGDKGTKGNGKGKGKGKNNKDNKQNTQNTSDTPQSVPLKLQIRKGKMATKYQMRRNIEDELDDDFRAELDSDERKRQLEKEYEENPEFDKENEERDEPRRILEEMLNETSNLGFHIHSLTGRNDLFLSKVDQIINDITYDSQVFGTSEEESFYLYALMSALPIFILSAFMAIINNELPSGLEGFFNFEISYYGEWKGLIAFLIAIIITLLQPICIFYQTFTLSQANNFACNIIAFFTSIGLSLFCIPGSSDAGLKGAQMIGLAMLGVGFLLVYSGNSGIIKDLELSSAIEAVKAQIFEQFLDLQDAENFTRRIIQIRSALGLNAAYNTLIDTLISMNKNAPKYSGGSVVPTRVLFDPEYFHRSNHWANAYPRPIIEFIESTWEAPPKTDGIDVGQDPDLETILEMRKTIYQKFKEKNIPLVLFPYKTVLEAMEENEIQKDDLERYLANPRVSYDEDDLKRLGVQQIKELNDEQDVLDDDNKEAYEEVEAQIRVNVLEQTLTKFDIEHLRVEKNEALEIAKNLIIGRFTNPKHNLPKADLTTDDEPENNVFEFTRKKHL